MLRRSGLAALRSSLVRAGASVPHNPYLIVRAINTLTPEEIAELNKRAAEKNLQERKSIEHQDHLKMGHRLADEVFRQEELIDEDEEISFEDEKVALAEEVKIEEPKLQEEQVTFPFIEIEETTGVKVDVEPEEVEEEAQQSKVEFEPEEIEEGDVPWYLRQDESSELDTPIFKTELPEIPQNSPPSIESMMKYAAEELGLDQFKIFDIRGREDIPTSVYVDFMIVSSGKSEKHIQNAVDAFSAYLKREFNTFPFVEGLLKANSMKRQKRRIKRKARKGTHIDTEFGVGPNSWVMIDTKLDGIIFHVLTDQRRKQVNLEYLWCKPEEKALYEKHEPRTIVEDDVDSIFHGLQRRYYTTGVEIEPIEQAFQQFKIGDLKPIKLGNDDSITFLQHIIDDLSSKPLERARKELSSSNNSTVQFFNNAFPILPTSQHFELRYQFYSILHKILPSTYPFEKLTTILIEQSSAGDFITDIQFNQYIQDLITTPQLSERIMTQDELNQLFKWKFKNLSDILRIMDLQKTINVDAAFLTNLLILSSQQHDTNKAIPVSRNFKVILDLFKNKNSNDTMTYMILLTMGKSQDLGYLSKFWDNELPTYKYEGLDTVEFDTRPWFILIQVVYELNQGKLNDWFLNKQLPNLLNNKVELTKEMKYQIEQVMTWYGAPHMKTLLEESMH